MDGPVFNIPCPTQVSVSSLQIAPLVYITIKDIPHESDLVPQERPYLRTMKNSPVQTQIANSVTVDPVSQWSKVFNEGGNTGVLKCVC